MALWPCGPAAQRLLVEAEAVVAEAEWGQLAVLRGHILGDPNNLRENLFSAVASLSEPRQLAAAKARVSSPASGPASGPAPGPFRPSFKRRCRPALGSASGPTLVRFWSPFPRAALQSREESKLLGLMFYVQGRQP